MPEDPTRQEVYVTELVGPNDRWVSVTDASRIGRRQEHTIRTWIAQGLLPVNPVRVGINKKTRQVRLSDLAKLTPIIDPDAGIATDLGTLDLPSIPKQQQQLMEQMAALQQEVAGHLTGMGEQFRALAGKHEQLAQRDDEHQQHLQQVRADLAAQAISYSQELQQTRQDFTTVVAETERALCQVASDQVGRSEAALRQAVESVRETSAEATEQVRQDVMGLEERLARAGEAHEELAAGMSRLQAHTTQQFSQVADRLGSLETTLGTFQSEIREHVERVDQQIIEVSSKIGQLSTQVARLESSWQERVTAAEQEARQFRRDLDAQARLLQMVQQQLDGERQAREAPARQVETLLQRKRRPARDVPEGEQASVD